MTNIEYDEHKGRIAIGRVQAGVLQKGMDVRVSIPFALFLFLISEFLHAHMLPITYIEFILQGINMCACM